LAIVQLFAPESDSSLVNLSSAYDSIEEKIARFVLKSIPFMVSCPLKGRNCFENQTLKAFFLFLQIHGFFGQD